MTWDWSRLIDVRIADGHLAAAVGPIVWIAGLVLLAVWLARLRPWLSLARGRWRVHEVTVNLLGAEWHIQRNAQTAKLAHEAYVELITRKAGIDFEEGDDVLTEIYDSWYALFRELRRLARQIDAEDIAKNEELKRLNDLLVAVLNQGLRPHLTRWHAKFRRWYAAEAERRRDASPQEIQRDYPEYDELVASLRDGNRMLIELATKLQTLAHRETGP